MTQMEVRRSTKMRRVRTRLHEILNQIQTHSTTQVSQINKNPVLQDIEFFSDLDADRLDLIDLNIDLSNVNSSLEIENELHSESTEFGATKQQILRKWAI